MKTLGNYIDGTSKASQNDRTAAIYNPATGKSIVNVSMSTKGETQEAIASARRALEKWKKVTPLNRARVLFKFKDLVESRREELVELITREHGKVPSDASGELTRGLEIVEFACGIPHLLKGDHSLNVGRGVDSFSLMQPVGVCAGITPFNFPAMVPMWMFPIAIACGNTFILKPSEKNPSVALFLAGLLTEAGLPDGVFNVVNGDKESVDVLLTDTGVDAVSFVGSTPIAQAIYEKASASGKRVQALGGAKNHMVVLPDANIKQAKQALMGAAFGSAGERCMAISVVVCVGDEVADELIRQLKEDIAEMKVGPGFNFDVEPHMGPLVSSVHADTVRNYISSGVEDGAALLVDGRSFTSIEEPDGFFVGPTLFDQVKPSMKIYQEEIFGPVLSVVRVNSYEEAAQLINDHEYGNGTTIFTGSGHYARKFCEDIEVGMVGVNVPIPVPMAFHSFGGWKRSIFGPLNMHGTDGVRFYSKMKTITSRWPTEENNLAQFSMPTME